MALKRRRAPAEGGRARKPGHRGERRRNSIVIRISDDGRGIAVDKVKAKALAKGLVSEAELATMEHREVLNLIFLPDLAPPKK
ncbi:MAG: hypothetical protein U0361_03165 [Nitrospiraceae bacterium]